MTLTGLRAFWDLLVLWWKEVPRTPRRGALETVYVPLTVDHMRTGKIYIRAARGHMMSASAVLSLLLEKFWHSLTAVKHTQLVKKNRRTQRNVKIKILKESLQCKGMSWTYMFKCTSNQTRIWSKWLSKELFWWFWALLDSWYNSNTEAGA